MLKGSKKQLTRKSSATPVAPPSVPVAPSLPPVPADGSRTSPTTPPLKLEPGSVMRRKALAIVGLKARGYTTEEIATELGIKPGSVHTYLWRAGRAGLVRTKAERELGLVDPTDRIEYELTNVAVDNLSDMLAGKEPMLERGQKSQKMEATLALAKGVLFEKFRKVAEAPTQNIAALKIELVMPTSGQAVERAGSVGGIPMSFIEGKVEGEK